MNFFKKTVFWGKMLFRNYKTKSGSENDDLLADSGQVH